MSLLAKVKAYLKPSTPLKRRLQLGEELARELVPLLRPLIVRTVGWDRTDDILQDCLEAIFRGLGGAKAKTEAKLRGWCLRIARNKAMDALRGKYAEQAVSTDPFALAEILEQGEQGTDIKPWDLEDLRMLLSLLRAAKFPCDQILWEHIVLGWSYEEMAEVYQVEYDTMRMKVRRCLEAAQELAKPLR